MSSADEQYKRCVMIGQSFVQFYYSTFDSDRTKLGALYKDSSLLNFDGAICQGPNAIVGKLESLKFQSVKHEIKSMDFMPCAVGILVLVCGDLKVDNEANPIKFSQTFLLSPTDASGSNFFIQSDMFRLNYG